ncbi:MAG: galactose mutarotase [Proteobacteria bacterium]|nr:galactose mutarotase [Pseudomonadota bacterium]
MLTPREYPLVISGLSLLTPMVQATDPSITAKPFGTTSRGGKVTQHTLINAKGASVSIITYGGIVTSLKVPDRNGKLADVVLGFKTLSEYEKKSPYFGCLVGRYGNRIAEAEFTLDGHTYHLAINNNGQSLHGGLRGFDKVVWSATPTETKQGPSLKLTYVSKDGEEGYPGNLSVTATYTLTNKNELKLVFRAKTDKATVVNLTHHSYFNLAGQGSGDILGHVVTIHADEYTPVDQVLIPTGKIAPVKGTPLDFRKPMAIGDRIDTKDEQLKFAGGYDHNFVAAKLPGHLGLIAKVEEPKSGRVMEVISTEPGVQFYSGNFLDGTLIGKGGRVYGFRNGFCIEPQHFPDSPNHKNFPSTVLKPGEIYRNTIIYRFSTAKGIKN